MDPTGAITRIQGTIYIHAAMVISIFFVEGGDTRKPVPIFGVVDTVTNQPKTKDGLYCW